MRNVMELKDNWMFVKEAENAEDAASKEGTAISLPHTWNAVDGQDGGNDYHRGTCWYVTKFQKPELEAGSQVYVEFLGASVIADVYLNGEAVAHHEGGYSTFRVNLTDKLQEENVLAVALNNADNNYVYPQKADFTFYGGLYRMVNLIVVPESHFELDYVGGNGIAVTPTVECDENRVPTGKASVKVETWVTGNADSVVITITGEESESKTVSVVDGHAEATFELEHVHLWDGVDDPYLYHAKAELSSGDVTETTFGCRSFYTDPEKGFVLNGRVYPLRGVSRHQDRTGAGNALSYEMHKEDMEIIKEIGANTIRLAHYQHAQEFYDLCDEYGMVVWAEIPYITMHMPNGRANTLSQMEELVVQNYNHPSIVCWGLSNEITAATPVDEDLLENHRLLNDLCHKLDKTRFTTMANVFMQETDSPLLEIPDVNSYNLYFGWYLGELEQNDEFFDEYHAKYPDRCIGFSEYGADANPQYQSTAPTHGDYSETYQTVYHEHMLKMIEERPYLWATHVWNMFDFAADGRDEGGKHGENQKGLVTMDRKLKKDAFYLYKAYWNKEDAFVHICGRRYVDRKEDTTEVKVYSNQTTVSLYVDGILLETQEGSRIFRFAVPMTGEHEIVAKAGAEEDSIHIRKVEEANPDYVMGEIKDVINWFDDEPYKPECYSIKDKMSEIQASPKAGAILAELMAQAPGAESRGDVAESVKDNPNLVRMMGRMTLESMLGHMKDSITEEQVKGLNRMLQQIKKGE
ncbi:glycoside hydrolase family 2 protein [Roseburia intestinalis]|uniref:glycoside hydrolase family 2 protein n=1 Tax=Roseburia intestinalis TaxID=166486 RepID=UPI001570F0FA|nr:glycoside hydrolase family 2 TIM barrel-domain containing protein [Roseburia intestinalis]NSC35254.1 glycoside hydrolase family 2 protein [Roseburia intestinalis]